VPADPALRRAHALLGLAFAADQVVSLKDWRETLRERAGQVWTDLRWHLLVAERRGRVVGMASGTYLGSVNVGMVGYLVLRPSARRLGIGSRLRRRLRECFERDAERIGRAPLTAIVGEVEPDNPWLMRLVAAERALALDIPYAQPSLAPGASPVQLVLYYQSLRGRITSVPAPVLRRLLYAIWRRIYRVPRPLTHPAFRRMLRALRDRRRVGRWRPR
jgi:GNAT superfamily N-acetyltransferase